MAAARVILITGCSSGIGRDLAARAAAAGFAVAATARDPGTLADLDAAVKVQLDVTDPWSVRRAVDAVYESLGRVDALVNNAGWAVRGAIEEVPEETAAELFDTNLLGVVRMVRSLVPRMRLQGGEPGRVVNVSSIAPCMPFPGHGLYAASKAALDAVTGSLRHELAPFGIPVFLVRPGPVRSGFSGAAAARSGAFFSDPGSPYRRLHEEMLAAESALRAGEGGPEAVSRVILRAVSARGPGKMYFAGVGLPLRALLAARGLAMDPLIRKLHPSSRRA
jgi:NAD(P)-dependent dehydrogenase (short-subunit alcohol dehydrogenase family)